MSNFTSRKSNTTKRSKSVRVSAPSSVASCPPQLFQRHLRQRLLTLVCRARREPQHLLLVLVLRHLLPNRLIFPILLRLFHAWASHVQHPWPLHLHALRLPPLRLILVRRLMFPLEFPLPAFLLPTDLRHLPPHRTVQPRQHRHHQFANPARYRCPNTNLPLCLPLTGGLRLSLLRLRSPLPLWPHRDH